MTDTQFIQHRHTVGLPAFPIRSWGVRAWIVSQTLLTALSARTVQSAGTVRSARSAINVAVGFACIAIGIAGLTSIWWGVLAAGPLWLTYDHLLGES